MGPVQSDRIKVPVSLPVRDADRVRQAGAQLDGKTVAANGWFTQAIAIAVCDMIAIEIRITRLLHSSQHSTIFVTYKSAHLARLFHNSKLERLTSDKLSNFLG